MPSEALDFTRRAHLSEWMDEPCSYEDFRACLLDLEQVNRLVLSYRPTLHWLQTTIHPGSRPIHIVDVGCGGGDMLRRVERWATSNRIAVHLTGIDLNPHAARAAREFTPPASRIVWITGDAFSFEPAVPIDIVLSSLFTHHLPDAEIVRFLSWMERVTSTGWFINDLHRQRNPYFGFRLLAKVMRWHRFVQHDGPISIRRAFSPEDWRVYANAAALNPAILEITTHRPGRLCVARVRNGLHL